MKKSQKIEENEKAKGGERKTQGERKGRGERETGRVRYNRPRKEREMKGHNKER